MLEEKNFITTNKRKLREISESNNDNLNVKRSEQKITNITTEIFDSSSSTIPHLSSVYGKYYYFFFVLFYLFYLFIHIL